MISLNLIQNILLISYGRIYNEVYNACSVLAADGIDCAMMKLTKIYPIAEEIFEIIKEYHQIVFFEEGMRSGSISEKVGNKLAEMSYSGKYSSVNIDEFVKQASVRSSLDRFGLTCDKITEYVRKRSFCNGKA